jgi:coniferyl-aldehyde dehydrogenase
LSPTILINPPLDCKLLEIEIFGPILPIVTFTDFDEVINKFILKKGKPLAIYYFGSSSSLNFRKIVDNTSSGNVTANDCLF